MTRTRIAALVLVTIVVLVSVGGLVLYRRALALDGQNRETADVLRLQIAALDTERSALRARLEDLVERDPHLVGMPETPVRVAVPTTLVRDLMERVVAGVADRVTLTLSNIRVRKTGSVRRVVTLGDYDLKVTVKQVQARLHAGTPRLTFGSNRIAIALPVGIASGTGHAEVDFAWDGRTIGGPVCGDMHLVPAVTGTVVPRNYRLSGSLHLQATDTEIVVQPRLPRLGVRIDVAPSAESWAAAQKVLDDRRGLCGFVLDRVDVLGAVERLIKRGFNVRLPTEKVTSMALPVAVEPTLLVRGTPVALGIRVGELVITEQAIWLGAHVSVATDLAAEATRREGPTR